MMNARALLIAGLAAGCSEVNVEALTPPPPGKIAVLDSENNTLELSRGVAFAFECTAYGGGYDGPCRDAKASTSHENIVTVYPSYLDSLGSAWDDGNAGLRSRTAFVVVALGEGKTEVLVKTADGDVGIDVTVKP
jgi:hypothetical protein